MHVSTYTYNEQSDEAMDLAFNKKRADNRKEWLMKYDRDITLDYTQKEVPYDEFVHKELIHYSNRDLERSINHVCDGLKESTRKIMFGCFKRRLFKNEVKVAQLAAYVSEHSAYHHGEASLQQAITGMAQVFVGTNNVNLLVPNGQFGSRIHGGSDAASPRYIFTVLSPLARSLYREEDMPILKYLDDDGTPVEPTYYIPIIPMVLVNGALGIGTGFSTNVPQHNPTDIITQCLTIISSLDTAFKSTSSQPNQPFTQIETDNDFQKAAEVIDLVPLPNLVPFYLGFTGSIISHKEGMFASRGVYRWVDDTTVEITELPIGTWSQDYKEFLESLIAANNPVLKDFESHYTAQSVRFLLKLHAGVRQGIENNFETEFKLISTKNLGLNNIHLYNMRGSIQKYADTNAVLREWAQTRIMKYMERKEHQIKTMEHMYMIISAKVRFIQDIINDKIKVMNKKIKDVEWQLAAAKYPTVSDDVTDMATGSAEADKSGAPSTPAKPEGSYAYLTRMPINQLTYEKKQALEKEASDINMKITELRGTPVHHIWRKELQELSSVWEEHRLHMESIYKADRENKLPATSGKKAPRGKK
jgi:DNA topoisomerase-2